MMGLFRRKVEAPAPPTPEQAARDARQRRRRIAEDQSTSADLLRELARDSSSWSAGYDEEVNQAWPVLPHIQIAVAENPNTPTDSLDELAAHGEVPVRHAVARNPNTRPDVLARLIGDADTFVAIGAVENPSTSRDGLARLFSDPEQLVEQRYLCGHLAHNPSAPGDLLAQLAYHPHHEYRKREVASHPNAPIETLAWLARQGEELELRVVDNPSASASLLDQLADDPTTTMRVLAAIRRRRG